jgi:hypothetical protein
MRYFNQLNLEATSPLIAGTQVIFTVPSKANITSPATAIYENS